MGWIWSGKVIGVLYLYVTISWSTTATSHVLQDADAITIEAAHDYSEDGVSSRTEAIRRQPKQVYVRSPALQLYQPFLLGELSHLGAPANSLAAGPCFSSKGILGRCTSFRDCFPYFKLPELGNWDTWVLGMYDTCSYFTSQGRQMFGVCCTIPQQLPEVTEAPITVESESEPDHSSETATNKPATTSGHPFYPDLNNWPPPIPTHPPDHTIPPLPTHPPSPGFPGIIPTTPNPGPDTTEDNGSWKPPNPKPTRPTVKPIRPPTYPTIGTTTTTAYPEEESGGPPGSCGAKNGFQDQERIVGGHNADIGEWPWIAALFNGGRQFCGGSLIDDIHILSAAHCVAHMSSWDVARLSVRLGDYNIKTNSEVRHIEKKVKRVVRHRGFDSRTLYNDIAILTLDSPVTFNKQIRPICLPSGSSTYAGNTATVIGWGSLRESGPQPSILQEVNIPIWSNGDCKTKYGPAAPGGIVEHMLCAGQANRDSCSGDSGGPLMVNNGRWTQVGVVSWGIGCGKGQYPGVYTRVENFLPWISKNLK